jgi:hypothetical protein
VGRSSESRYSAGDELEVLMVDFVPKLSGLSLQAHYYVVVYRFRGVESEGTYFDSSLVVRFALFLLCCSDFSALGL